MSGTGSRDTGAAPTCEICGRGPATAVHAKKYSGLLLYGDTTFWKGDACRQCGTSLYRTGASHSMWAGWWGPIPFVVNPFVLRGNFAGLRRVRALAEPVDPPLAEPLDIGRPVFRRPAALAGALVPVAVVVALVAGLLAIGGRVRVDDLATGDCITLGNGPTLRLAERRDCDEPHAAEVTGRVGGAADGSAGLDADRCTAVTLRYLGGSNVDGLAAGALRYSDDDGSSVSLVCLVVATTGTTLRGSQRGSGG